MKREAIYLNKRERIATYFQIHVDPVEFGDDGEMAAVRLPQTEAVLITGMTLVVVFCYCTTSPVTTAQVVDTDQVRNNSILQVHI